METISKIPKQQDYLTIIDNTLVDYYTKYQPITINGSPVPVKFVNSNRLALWINNTLHATGIGKNKGDLPTPCILINREETSEIFSNFNQPWSKDYYVRIHSSSFKKRALDAILINKNSQPTEYVWIKKPKPLKFVYNISCYSKFNLDINEFYTQMLDRMNATNIVLPNLPDNLDLRFFFENKVSSKDNKNTSTERYIICTFVLNVDGFIFNLNDVYKSDGIENISMKIVENEDEEELDSVLTHNHNIRTVDTNINTGE